MGLRRRHRRSMKYSTWYKREAYRQRYMRSSLWWARRQEWIQQEQRRKGVVVCPWCGHEAGVRDDFHHVSYARLGREAHSDLIVMHRACHELLHRHMDVYRRSFTLMRGSPRTATLRFIHHIQHGGSK